jgi:methyltransferase (TIGR00027 family)
MIVGLPARQENGGRTAMKENKPSETALRVALRRAAHQILDLPKVLDDPVAMRIIGPERAGVLQADPKKHEAHPLSPYLRAFTAARSRCAEDELARGALHGVRQFVVLGAGLDTFAYRNPHPPGIIRVFEVDHPWTQEWKRSCLEVSGIAPPTDLTFAPVDFETQTLPEGLAKAGFNPGEQALFSWLGVTEYLAEDTVVATLAFIASLPKGSGVVFDYMLSPELLTEFQLKVFNGIAQRVAAAGEPWQSFFDPARLEGDLLAMGFREVEDLGPDDINARYFADRTDGLKVGSLSHVMIARV